MKLRSPYWLGSFLNRFKMHHKILKAAKPEYKLSLHKIIYLLCRFCYWSPCVPDGALPHGEQREYCQDPPSLPVNLCLVSRLNMSPWEMCKLYILQIMFSVIPLSLLRNSFQLIHHVPNIIDNIMTRCTFSSGAPTW